MFENPNVKYWNESNHLVDRSIFHCANQMKKYAKGNLIDMGAGIAILTDFFTENNKNISSVTAVDFSDIHENLLIEKGYNFLKINLDSPMYNLESNKYDTVLSTDVVEHLLSPFSYLDECFRILKKDGFLIISTPDAKREVISIPHINFFSSESFEKYLMRVGFEKKNIKRVYNGIINPKITYFLGKIPFVRTFFSEGLYYICKK